MRCAGTGYCKNVIDKCYDRTTDDPCNDFEILFDDADTEECPRVGCLNYSDTIAGNCRRYSQSEISKCAALRPTNPQKIRTGEKDLLNLLAGKVGKIITYKSGADISKGDDKARVELNLDLSNDNDIELLNLFKHLLTS